MSELFDFESVSGGIIITAYKGKSPIVTIPKEASGERILEIGDGAFRGMEFIAEVIFEEGLLAIGNYAFCQCTGLKSVVFPSGLKEIGGHAFYNCRGIEEITLPQSLVFAGDGFIKNCGSIKTVKIASAAAVSSAIISVLNELKEEFVLHMEKENARLLFPAYDYEFAVNAPARLCTTYTVGSGERYRQAISAKGINFDVYDKTFPWAVAEEKESTVFRVIFERLLAPYKLNSALKYEQYLRDNIENAVKYASENGGEKLLSAMDSAGAFTAENIDAAVCAAAECESSEAAAFMLNLRLAKFKRKPKTFEL